MSDPIPFSGYAARFNERDLNGDIIRPGAFSRSLRQRPEPVRMLYQHKADQPIGVWQEIREDQSGLFVRGRLITETVLGRDIGQLLSAGALNGLSIGFRTIRASPRRSGRDLLQIDLWEISIVTFPMAPGARILRVGSTGADPVRLQERLRSLSNQLSV